MKARKKESRVLLVRKVSCQRQLSWFEQNAAEGGQVGGLVKTDNRMGKAVLSRQGRASKRASGHPRALREDNFQGRKN